MKVRDDLPILGSRSPRRSVRLLRSSTFNASGGYGIGLCTARSPKFEGVGFDGTNSGGLAHFLGAGAPRGGMKEADGLGLRSRLGGREVCGLHLCLFWLSALAGSSRNSGFAHFEIGRAHSPRPAGVDVASGDGKAVGLPLETSHLSVRALTCVKQCVGI